MKKLIFISLLIGLSINESLAVVYYACGTGINWDGSTSFLYTTPTCTAAPGQPINPNLLTSADEMVIQSGAQIVIVGNQTLNAIKLTVYGNLFIKSGGTPGKLELPNNSATVVLQPGSVLACWDGAMQVTCAPSSTQIIVGTAPTKYTYKGSDIDTVNGLAKPVTLDNLGTPLPITLLHFTASKMLREISLSWATASELNFDYFDIEKSPDGKIFQSLAKVTGHGTTNERNDYALDDEKPYIGKNYYRLKSVDFDGYTEYFNVVRVDFDGSKAFAVSPNPSDGFNFMVETNFVPETRAYVAIYSTLGSEIGRYEVSGDKSELVMPVKLASGIYYAKYISGDFTSTNRLVVR